MPWTISQSENLGPGTSNFKPLTGSPEQTPRTRGHPREPQGTRYHRRGPQEPRGCQHGPQGHLGHCPGPQGPCDVAVLKVSLNMMQLSFFRLVIALFFMCTSLNLDKSGANCIMFKQV